MAYSMSRPTFTVFNTWLKCLALFTLRARIPLPLGLNHSGSMVWTIKPSKLEAPALLDGTKKIAAKRFALSKYDIFFFN